MSHLIAGIDESIRPNKYLLCAAVISTADRANVRQALRGLLLPNQRRLHAYSERGGRRLTLLKTMTELPGVRCHIVVGQQRRQGAREACLDTLVRHLIALKVRETILERVDHGTAKRDRQLLDEIARASTGSFEWRHEAPHLEPLLWISDLVAFAQTAGGDLQRASEPLIESLTTVTPGSGGIARGQE